MLPYLAPSRAYKLQNMLAPFRTASGERTHSHCIRRTSSSGRQDWPAGWDTNFFHGAKRLSSPLQKYPLWQTSSLQLTHFATPNTTCYFF